MTYVAEWGCFYTCSLPQYSPASLVIIYEQILYSYSISLAYQLCWWAAQVSYAVCLLSSKPHALILKVKQLALPVSSILLLWVLSLGFHRLSLKEFESIHVMRSSVELLIFLLLLFIASKYILHDLVMYLEKRGCASWLSWVWACSSYSFGLFLEDSLVYLSGRQVLGWGDSLGMCAVDQSCLSRLKWSMEVGSKSKRREQIWWNPISKSSLTVWLLLIFLLALLNVNSRVNSDLHTGARVLAWTSAGFTGSPGTLSQRINQIRESPFL